MQSGSMLHILEGHADFVKSLTILPSSDLFLLSTSSDRTVRLWDLAPLLVGGIPSSIQTIRDHHTRPVECATWKLDYETEESVDARLTVWTADSLGVIKRWLLEGRALRFIADESGHETSVARMVVGDDGLWSGGSSDAWPRLNGIVSMDKTATYHAFDSVKPATIPHSGYVKSVLPIPSASSGKSLVLTGSEDEEIRVWDVTHSPGAPAKLLSTVSGHCGEVSVMRWWQRQSVADGRPAWVIVSGSLDGTLRRWTLQGENTDTVPR